MPSAVRMTSDGSRIRGVARQPGLSPELRKHLDHYSQSHQTPENQVLHFLGIPLFLISTLGLLSKVSLGGREKRSLRPDAAWPVVLGSALWYLSQDRRLGLWTTATFAGSYFIGRRLSSPVLLSYFGAGVLAHMIGHYGFEGKPPAFFSRPLAVFEAPPWLLSKWAGIYRNGPTGGGTQPRR